MAIRLAPLRYTLVGLFATVVHYAVLAALVEIGGASAGPAAAGNILWTYVLPGLPALAMVLAMWMRRLPREARLDRLVAGGITFTALGAVFVIAGFHHGGWTELKSTKALVADYESSRSGTEALLFFRRQPLSSAFYSEGRAVTVREPGELQIQLTQSPAFVAIREQHLARLPGEMLRQLDLVSRRGNYGLYQSSRPLANLHPETVSAIDLTQRGEIHVPYEAAAR
ncbi:MAG: hypothetical protein WD944_04960 [Steroidobacteraceae bacterium]